jgi:hypothetical protein
MFQYSSSIVSCTRKQHTAGVVEFPDADVLVAVRFFLVERDENGFEESGIGSPNVGRPEFRGTVVFSGLLRESELEESKL